jgi:hypothetical protein
MKHDIDSFDALLHVCMLDLIQEDRRNRRGTIKTKSRSSNIMASWISNGTRSKGSCFPFPFTLGALALDTTRELSGARTKDVSAINEESCPSLWPASLSSFSSGPFESLNKIQTSWIWFVMRPPGGIAIITPEVPHGMFVSNARFL